MRVAGVDACRNGWVAVALDAGAGPQMALDAGAGPQVALDAGAGAGVAAWAGASLAALLAPWLDRGGVIAGIDMPLGLLEKGWREADRAARGLLGPRRSSVFAIPPRAVWAEVSYPLANERCRELTGQAFSVQSWGLRARLLEANQYRERCGHPLYEIHPELAFAAMAGQPLAHSKHTAAGRDLRRQLLSRAGIEIPAVTRAVPVADVLDAAAVAWSARRVAAGRAVTVPAEPQRDRAGREIAIRY
jgi:predicted RNase H-like nuclease